jgi:hypothetical protein
MKGAMKVAIVLALGLSGLCTARASDWFEYDKSAPLAYEDKLISTRDGTRIYDSSYATPKGGCVRAYTVAPDNSGRFAAVVWQHGGTGFCRMRSLWPKPEPYLSSWMPFRIGLPQCVAPYRGMTLRR